MPLGLELVRSLELMWRSRRGYSLLLPAGAELRRQRREVVGVSSSFFSIYSRSVYCLEVRLMCFGKM